MNIINLFSASVFYYNHYDHAYHRFDPAFLNRNHSPILFTKLVYDKIIKECEDNGSKVYSFKTVGDRMCEIVFKTNNDYARTSQFPYISEWLVKDIFEDKDYKIFQGVNIDNYENIQK